VPTQTQTQTQGADDAALYRRQYVWEQLAALYRSPASDSASLDLPIARITQQAARVPAAAAHLVRSAGLLPFLAAAAVEGGGAGGAGSGTRNAACGGAWALGCLEGLLRHQIGLVHREHAPSVFDSYMQAVGAVAAHAAAASAHAGGQHPPSCMALRLICMLARAAPGRRELQRMQQVLASGPQAAALLAAVAGAPGSGSSSGSSSRGRGLSQPEHQFLALLLHLPAPAFTPEQPEQQQAAWSLAQWAADATLRLGPATALDLDSALDLKSDGAQEAKPAACGVQLIGWLDRLLHEAGETTTSGIANAGSVSQLVQLAWGVYASLSSKSDLEACRAPLLRVLSALVQRRAEGQGGGGVVDGVLAAAAGADVGAAEWDAAVLLLRKLAAGLADE